MGINEKDSRWRDKGTEIKQFVKAQLIYLTEEILKILNIGTFLTDQYDDINLVTAEFKLIQDEIIESATNSIEGIVTNNSKDTEKEAELRRYIVNNFQDIKKLIQAVKQLNKKLEESKNE